MPSKKKSSPCAIPLPLLRTIVMAMNAHDHLASSTRQQSLLVEIDHDGIVVWLPLPQFGFVFFVGVVVVGVNGRTRLGKTRVVDGSREWFRENWITCGGFLVGPLLHSSWRLRLSFLLCKHWCLMLVQFLHKVRQYHSSGRLKWLRIWSRAKTQPKKVKKLPLNVRLEQQNASKASFITFRTDKIFYEHRKTCIL